MPATQSALRIQEVPGYTQTHPGRADDKALRVEWDGIPLGLLYVTPTAFTLAWEGIVAFDRLEAEVAGSLTALGLTGVTFDRAPWRDRTTVAFVFPRKDDSDELVKYHLSESGDYARYSRDMTNSLAIAFARYDLSGVGQPPRAPFSFIAENASLRQGLESEVALKLGRNEKWSEKLLEWVLAHHRRGNLLRKEVALKPSVSVLNQYVGGA